jgi:glucosylceramidase
VAHAARFVRPGSVRIASDESAMLPNVAFRTPDGRKVLILVNATEARQSFAIGYAGKSLATALDPGAVATYVW